MSFGRALLLCSVLAAGFIAGYTAHQVVLQHDVHTAIKPPSGNTGVDDQCVSKTSTIVRPLRGVGGNPCPSRAWYWQSTCTNNDVVDIVQANRNIAILSDYTGHSIATIIDALTETTGTLYPDGVKRVFTEIKYHKDPNVRVALVEALDPEKDKKLLAELLFDDNELVRKSVVERFSKDASESGLKASKQYIDDILATEADEDVLLSIMDFFHTGFPSEVNLLLTLGDNVLQHNNLSPDDLVHMYDILTDVDVDSESAKKLIMSSPAFLSIPEDSKELVIRRIAASDMVK